MAESKRRGKWELIKPIGRGGQGQVYLVRDVSGISDTAQRLLDLQDAVIGLVNAGGKSQSAEPEVAAELARRAASDPRLVLVTGHGNVGFARGCNIGVRRARGRNLMLPNPDCRLAPGAIPALLARSGSNGTRYAASCVTSGCTTAACAGFP